MLLPLIRCHLDIPEHQVQARSLVQRAVDQDAVFRHVEVRQRYVSAYSGAHLSHRRVAVVGKIKARSVPPMGAALARMVPQRFHPFRQERVGNFNIILDLGSHDVTALSAAQDRTFPEDASA